MALLTLSSACGGSVGATGSDSGGPKDPDGCACDTTYACVDTCVCDVDCLDDPPSGDEGAIDLGGDEGGGGGEEPIDIPGAEGGGGGGGGGGASCGGPCNTDGECDEVCSGNGVCVASGGERECQPGPAGGGNPGGGGGGGGGGGIPGGGEVPEACFTECADNSDCSAECGAGWSCQGFGGFGFCVPDGL